MFLSRYIACVTLLVSTLLICPAYAQSNEGRKPLLTEDQNNSPTINELSNARAIKLSIVDGVIDFANNRKRARFFLTWDVLPEPPEITKKLLQEARRNVGIPQETSNAAQPCGSKQVMTITIPNADIGQPKRWFSKLTEEEKTCLQDALAVSDLNLITPEELPPGSPASFDSNKNFRRNFRNFWIGDDAVDPNIACKRNQSIKGYARSGCGRALIRNVTVPQYYNMLRDYNILTSLLETQGVAYSLTLDGIEASLPGDTTLIPYNDKKTYISYQDINWEITIYRRLVSDAKDFDVSYYRFAVRAVTKPIEIQFRSSEKDPSVSVEMSFRKDDSTIGISDLFPKSLQGIESQPVLSNEIQEQISSLQNIKADSQLNVAFRNITGISASQVVSQGILGGSSNTSVIAGGLIGNDEIQSLVGANLEVGKINSNLVPGLLLGVSPCDDDATLFLGPSLRFSIFTLAAGARVFDLDDGLRIRPAGVVSLDLTRIFSGEQNQQIALEDPNQGGGWFDLSSVVSQNLEQNIALIGYKLKIKQPKRVRDNNETQPNVKLSLVRDDTRCKAEEPKGCQPEGVPNIGQELKITLQPAEKELLLFLPIGRYKFDIPDGYVLKSCQPKDKKDNCQQVEQY